jgi:spore germination protein YaaH
MKTANKLPIIGFVVGLILVLTSITLFVVFRTEVDDITSSTPSTQNNYKPANVNDVEKFQEVESETNQENEEIEEEEKTENIELKKSGWIPNWGFDLGYESLINNEGIIDTVMPVLYTVNSSGNVVSRGVSDSKIAKLMTYCTENNITVLPTVGSYDFDSMSASLATKDSYTKQINTIISEIEKYDFDGIDLDYEMIRTSDKNNFLRFIQELSTELDKKDKILSVTVFPQWKDATYKDHQETRAVQDYTEVGKYADEVRIMAYDYTLQSSKTPGPIAPVNWMREVLDYATDTIPKEKIWLGVHLYGYQWSSDRTIAFTYTTTEASFINDPSINNIFKEDIGEGYAEFNCDDGYLCKAYFQTPRGVEMRRNIAEEYGIAGIAYWRLGSELDILK